MDTEEGVEVVWNEVQFSERKNFKAQEEKIQLVFENLTQLEHPNIVKFHRYWTDTHNDKPRVSHSYLLVFYTLYLRKRIFFQKTTCGFVIHNFFIFFLGNIHYGIYVFWVFEAVPETNKT